MAKIMVLDRQGPASELSCCCLSSPPQQRVPGVGQVRGGELALRNPAKRQRFCIGHQEAFVHEHLHRLARVQVGPVVQSVLPLVVRRVNPKSPYCPASSNTGTSVSIGQPTGRYLRVSRAFLRQPRTSMHVMGVNS